MTEARRKSGDGPESLQLNGKAVPAANGAAPQTLNFSWRGDTWQMFGELPEGREKAHNNRNMILDPPAKQRSMDLLDDAGVACCVIKGDKYGDLEAKGQDNISISLITGGWEVYCVADGHGSIGHWVATHATRCLPHFLSTGTCQRKLAEHDPRGALLQAFEETQDSLMEQANKDSNLDKLAVSGATFGCILKDPERKSAWFAHVGEPRTIMFSPDACLLQTQDHSVKVPAERKRIEDCGCEVRTKSYDDGFETTRIYVKGTDYPGIMMTRCFGDLCVKGHGIIAEPEITHWEKSQDGASAAADANECYVLCASDGIWEFMDTQAVHELVSNHLREGKSLQLACNALVEEAKRRWAASEPEYCDDISVIILPLTGKALPPVDPSRETAGSSMGCFSGCARCVVQ